MSRAASLKRCHWLYEPRGMIGDPCTYCGIASDTMDHIPPIASMQFATEEDMLGRRPVLVPACRECNATLGARWLMTVAERRKHCRDHLRKKYAKYLRMPRWDEDELSELDDRLADDFRRASKFADLCKRRISWGRK